MSAVSLCILWSVVLVDMASCGKYFLCERTEILFVVRQYICFALAVLSSLESSRRQRC